MSCECNTRPGLSRKGKEGGEGNRRKFKLTLKDKQRAKFNAAMPTISMEGVFRQPRPIRLHGRHKSPLRRTLSVKILFSWI